jgi:MFS family permease
MTDNLATRFYWSKWLTFSFATLLQLSSGLGYTFSIYSNDLKRHFNWNQQQTAAIGTACNVGGYFPLFAGLFYDSMKAYDWLGPMLTVLIGVVLQFGGYYGMWAAAVGHINPPYWVMILLAVAACNGQAWYETAGLVTSVRNFETERGTVIGILKAFLGLSASAYITIYVSFIEPDAIKFLKILALAPTAVALFSSLFINYVPFIQVEPHTKSHAFHMIFTAVIALAFYQTVIAIARSEAQDINFWTGVLMTSAVAVLMLPVMAIPFIFGGPRATQLQISKHTPRKGPMPSIAARAESDLNLPLLEQQQQQQSRDAQGPQNPVEMSPLQCLRSADFWMLFAINGICSGAGLTLLNNVGQQVISLGDRKVSQSGFVSLFSVANCVSRLLAGVIPDRLMKVSSVPRTASMVVLAAMSAGAAVLNGFADTQLLNLSSFLSGFAFGGMQGITPAITSELFGLQNFATNYAIVQMGPALGSYTMATELAAAMYNRVMAGQPHHGKHGGDGACHGPYCFRWTFLMVAALCCVATAFAAALWYRSRTAYQQVIKVMMAERMKRGIKAEMEEAREILDAYVEENRALVDLLAKGRSHVQELQTAATAFQPEDPTEAAMAHAVRELTGLVEGANALLSGSKGLETKYLSLPSYASQRLSLALEADPNASTSAPMPAAGQRTGGATHRLYQSARNRARSNDELLDV